jgi:hypothetical protein
MTIPGFVSLHEAADVIGRWKHLAQPNNPESLARLAAIEFVFFENQGAIAVRCLIQVHHPMMNVDDSSS